MAWKIHVVDTSFTAQWLH